MPAAYQRNLPNILTLLRLVLAAAFFASLNAYRYPDVNRGWAMVAVVVFIAAAATDTLDGWLARRWRVETAFGRIMDPFCDKVLVIGAFIYLAGPRFVVPQWVDEGSFFTMATAVYPWMIVVILGRELLVTSVRGVLESQGVHFGAKLPGKLKMILQSVTVPVVIALVALVDTGRVGWARWVCTALVYATVVATLWSGVPYVVELRRLLRAGAGPGPADPSSVARQRVE